ncbi:L-alanyl-D-glutamate peptidase [Schinkia azotoformans LMG 9581]|uniref:L-alanyl-D-glutamate peptidase n=1 Tax=Schinkia azotoformans LMG 9581 TaxID=1131731 RepID=K6DIG5_SCHAZ|nr:L-alanyl-D-glutamate peptidase [Schinkia azotoformans LMG 9581]
MTLTYYKRNLENIDKLADHTKIVALKWHDYLVKNDINILIYETIRTVEMQRENVRKGASKTMKSYHLVGQALDFVPVDSKGQSDWKGYDNPKIKQAIIEAKRLGFEWGGDWKSFIDKPHLQFNHKGYGTDTFGKYTELKNGEDELLKLENYQWDMLITKLKKCKNDAEFSSEQWIDKAVNRTMTVSELVWLHFVIDDQI